MGRVTKLVRGVSRDVNESNLPIFTSNADDAASTDWSTYADAAGTRPVDGTGGSPTVTFTRSTSSPIEGPASWIFTKDAANRQGQGASRTFSVDLANRAKVLNIEIDYNVVSGTFVAGTNTTDSDLIIYLYDITNGQLIEPSSIKLLSNSTTLSDNFRASFQTSATGSSYRLIIHCATTSAAAYTVKFDNISVSPSKYIYGTPISDWRTQTGITVNLTNSTLVAYSRRVGDSTELSLRVTFSGAPGAVSGTTFSLPSGLNIDTAKITGNIIGFGRHEDTGNARYAIQAIILSSSSIGIRHFLASGSFVSDADVTHTSPFVIGSGDFMDINVSFPVVGWSSSVQMSDQADTRVVAFYTTRTTDQTGINTNNTEVKVTLNTVINDTHGSFNTSTNQYVVPVAGFYKFNGSIGPLNTNILAGRYQARIYRNGSSNTFGRNTVFSAGTAEVITVESAPIFCNVGDTIELRIFGAPNNSASTITINGDSTVTFLSGQRITGPVTIAATETVAIKYQNNAGTSIPSPSLVPVPYATKMYDTHNAWNGTVFTAPVPGKYRVSVAAFYSSAAWTVSTTTSIALRKNGSITDFLSVFPKFASITTELGLNGSVPIDLLAGDTLEIRLQHNEGTARVLSTAAVGLNWISIERIGN